MSEPTAIDILGLGGTLPGPGWAVLDAARDQRFTGELVAVSDVTVRVYFDRGRIYVAERATDPPLGIRLVEAGALNHAQLEYGSLRVGDIEHLGRLFERVPSVNRDGVLVLNELMTEECIRTLAVTQVKSVTATPYQHHPSGMHRWGLFDTGGSAPPSSAVPEMALPAPHPDATPVATSPPAESPRSADLVGRPDRSKRRGAGSTSTPPDKPTTGAVIDDVVAWNEPSSPIQELVGNGAAQLPRSARVDLLTDDPPDLWIDELDHDGVADAEVDGGAAQSRLAPLPVRPVDQFEMIWPSGETEDVVDGKEPPPDTDHDRVGPTARVPVPEAESDATDTDESEDEDGETDTSDGDNRLAVRRAVATIDTGSLDARRRLADVSSDAMAPPGRLVVQREASVWRGVNGAPTTSVFDEQPVDVDEAEGDTTSVSDDHQGRSNALRRLIDSLKRS